MHESHQRFYVYAGGGRSPEPFHLAGTIEAPPEEAPLIAAILYGPGPLELIPALGRARRGATIFRELLAEWSARDLLRKAPAYRA